jgi:hypothetical protein
MNSSATPQEGQRTESSSAVIEAPPQQGLLAGAKIISGSSFFFAVLQSVCSAFIALSGARLLIGVGAFAAASSTLRIADRMHISAIRIPMMLLALIGSLWNLAALWRAWSLRRRPASAWRQQPISKQRHRSERIQFSLSVLTLLLLAAEFVAHYFLLGKG